MAFMLITCGSALAAKPKTKPAARPCGPAAEAYASLKDAYGERPFAEMLDSDNHDIIVFVSPKTWTWTIFEDTHDGRWCAIANGTGFSPADEKKFQSLLNKKS